MVKLICAGFPKTGTKSLTKALSTLGNKNVYDYLEHIDYFLDDYDEFFKGAKDLDNVLDKYEERDVECIVDMPPSFFFEEFFKRWPKAKVILTVREEDAWFKSIKKMNETTFNDYHWMTWFSKTSSKFENFMRLLYQHMLGSGLENSWLWRMHYRRHNAYVQSVVPAENLLVLDVKQGWEPLCRFLGKDVPEEPFPFVNAAGSKGNIIERLLGETAIARKAKYEIIATIIFYFAIVCILMMLYVNAF